MNPAARRKLAISPLTRPGTIVAWNPKSWDADFDCVVVDDRATIPAFVMVGDAAVIEIYGALVQRGNWLQDGYDTFLKRAEKAFASDAVRVVLDIASPGGDFAGCLEFSRELRNLADKAKKPLIAFSGSQAASAAFAIACAADKIIGTDSACLGSIGAWMPMVDQTTQDKMMGLNIQIVASGALKTARNPHVQISEAALEATQATVDGMAALFFEWVSERRNLPVSRIKGLEGADFLGAKAMGLGLVDEMTLSLNSYLSGAFKASNPQGGGKAMGKFAEEARVALRRCIDGDGDEDEKKKATKALKAMADEEKEEEKEKEAAAKAADESKKEEDEKAAKAKAADEEKEKEAKAQAAAGDVVAMARRLHTLETERAAEKLAVQVKALLDSRPDFSLETRRTLASAPLTIIEEAVKNWPKIPGTTASASASAAVTPNATRGEHQGTTDQTPDTRTNEADYIAKKMGQASGFKATQVTDRSLELGFLSDADLAKRAAELGIR